MGERIRYARLFWMLSVVAKGVLLFPWAVCFVSAYSVIPRYRTSNFYTGTPFVSPPPNERHIQLWSRVGKDKVVEEASTTTAVVPTILSDSNENASDWMQPLIQATLPMQQVLDTVSDGWVLSYANLQPDTPQTPAGQLFLFTNVAYALVGLLLIQNCQDYWFGPLTDLVALLSFHYHYQQLRNTDRNAVRLALLLDYIGALVTIFTGFYYLVSPTLFTNGSFQAAMAAITQMQSLQFESLIYSLAGILFLISSWVWEAGRPYMALHGMWHVCSAYSGYLIGTYHHSVTIS